MASQIKVLMSTGGTAGHLKPALNVCEELLSMGVDKNNIYFMGSSAGQEKAEVEKSGYRLYVFDLKGLKRKINAESLLFFLKLSAALIKAFYYTRKIKPDVCVSFGGYASFPGAVASILLRTPLIIVNLDAEASLVNKILRPFARIVTTNFETSNLKRQYFVGNPISKEVLNVRKDKEDEQKVLEAYRYFGIAPQTKVILLMGGSLGAKVLNDLADDLTEHFSQIGIYLIHIAGRRGINEIKKPKDDLKYIVKDFEPNIFLAYRLCDVAITRGGANTLYELVTCGIPTIAIPLKNAPRDHQMKNCQYMKELGAIEVIKEDDLNAETLIKKAEVLLNDAELRNQMKKAGKKIYELNASKQIANLIILFEND
jgi:UDP-N-acetylglucosamine--N-acetylmuramyl-(pentapeptide) pyrophosphoryl-undecaprenol N-acetylglucosamine transferase